MSKFKAGDRVKIVNSLIPSPMYRCHVGSIGTIDTVTPNGNCRVKETGAFWYPFELELAPLTIEEKREKLFTYCSTRTCGSKTKDECPLYSCKHDCEFKNPVKVSDEEINKAYSIVFEKGEKDMNKFTKKDLKNGDVILRRDGDVEIVIVDTGTILNRDHGAYFLSKVNDDLTSGISSDRDIMAVRRLNRPADCDWYAFRLKKGNLVYERKEVEEMTLEEVCKALGKEIKIVKK